MLDTLISIDRYFFLLINHLPHSFVSDAIARGLSGVAQWGIVWIVFSIVIFFREEIKDHMFFFPFILVGILSIVSEYILKWIIARPRPSVDMGAIILATPGNYSFPSTHATLSFAFAYIFSYVDKKSAPWVYAIAICVSFSRVYLGVHYPLDVLSGAVLGSAIGILARAMENLVKTTHRR